MIADLGHVALLLALAASVYAAAAFVIGVNRDDRAVRSSARNATYGACFLVTLAVIALVVALVSKDFKLLYVANYGGQSSPLLYSIAALWAGNSGSLLFWGWVLALSSAVLVWRNRDRDDRLMGYAGAAALAVQALFLILVVFVSDSFELLAVAPADGPGLNPQLENIGMIFHPTTLLAGYAGFTIPFALGVSALITRTMDDRWLASVRRWVLAFWLLLGVGNILGMQWAYMELGWGGYWAWDPIENAGLIPWLTATALVHSLMVQRRRQAFKVWNISLIGATFFLAILGTFFNRTDLFSQLSVHAYPYKTGLEPFFTVYLLGGVVLFLGLMASRASFLRPDDSPRIEWFSREGGFFLNNMVLIASAIVVIFGTLSPLFIGGQQDGDIAVQTSFFNFLAVPLLVLLVLLMGICPLIAWYRANNRTLRNMLYPTYVGLATAIVLLALSLAGMMKPAWYATVVFSICAFVLTAILLEWARGTRARRRTRGESHARAFFSLVTASRARYGGYFVHIGVILMAMGIAASSTYGTHTDVTMSPGQSADIGGYTLEYDGPRRYASGSTNVVAAAVSVTQSDGATYKLEPGKLFKIGWQSSAGAIGLHTGAGRDLYVILLGPDSYYQESYGGGGVNDQAAFRVHVNPLVLWIWIGGALLLLGTIVALWPGKSR